MIAVAISFFADQLLEDCDIFWLAVSEISPIGSLRLWLLFKLAGPMLL
jgi:hypothetical protein